MAQFLMYEVWGGLVFNIPTIALSIYVGWKLSNYIIKGRKWNTKYIKPIAGLFALIIFIILKSLMMN